MGRAALIGLAAILLLAACNPSGDSKGAENPLEGANLVGWADVAAEDIAVPEGVSFTQTTVGGATVAEIAAVPESAASTGKTGGVSVRLPAAFEQQASGARVQVTVRAMAPTAGARLGLAYSTYEVGNSGWQQFSLTQTPADYVFAYDVPAMRNGNGDFIGFRSYGDGRVQIVGFRTEIISPPPAGAAP